MQSVNCESGSLVNVHRKASADLDYGEKRNAHMNMVISIFENGKIEDLVYTKGRITNYMRGITDYCANEKKVYQKEKRTQIVYKYSKQAWKLKDTEKNKGLVGDHVMPLDVIFQECMRIRQEIGRNCGHHLREFLDQYLEVIMITSVENKMLNSSKLQYKMPPGFSFATMKTKYPRYDAVGIKIEPQSNKNSLKNQTY